MARQKPKEPQQIAITGNLNLGGPFGLPIRLIFGDDITKAIQTLVQDLARGGDLETKVFACKGANNQLGEVTVLASVKGDYVGIRCPRLQDELRYIREGFDTLLEHSGHFCYSGEDLQNVPVVKEEEFAAHKIFKCPYAGG